ncbi:LPXTG cell wall anchor domain-containing protein [Limosilactobacillus sp. RRLNB_1_1]|uniref:LPXTG cell wall anchor domain-containing protein n=1 Tax=Limosilactobacillus albertensis TaxID=2759752 RepID=A0A7W3Y8T4_9LACO|nr:LPXTG cell wall anchor domain-containing protein [Limosilactobacillus albertensis]
MEPGQPTEYKQVDSPEIKGYTPDQKNIPATAVTQDNIEKFVTYTKNAEEKANLKIVDDTTGKTLNTLNAQGDEDTPITFAGGKSAVQGYLDHGYKFVSVVSDAKGKVLSTTDYDAANFGNYDTDPNSDQSFTVHLVHGTKPVNPENPTAKYTKNDLQKTSTRTINYVDANGNKIADSVTSTVVFSGSGYVDTVTGNLVNLNNDGSIKDQNGKLTWTYSVDGGKAQSGENYTFAETAEKPTVQHDGVNYRFNNVNPGNYNAGNGAVSSYQVDNSKDNNLNVNVVYNKITYTTKRVNERTVNRTINYLDGKTGEKIPTNLIAGNPVNQSATLYQTRIVDDQGNEMGNGTVSEDGTSYTIDNTWHVDGSFDAVTSPDLTKSGYKAPRFENGKSAATVSAETVNENTPKQDTVNVYYDHNEVPVTPDNPHGVDPKQLTKDVNETVHYIVEDGKAKAPADNVQTSKWTRTLTLDEVTKELVPNGQYDTEWAIAKGQKTVYDQVKTPVVDGYYANKANVPATAVTQSNIYTEVTYKPLGHIIPVDPTTGNPIPNAPQPQFPNDPNDPTKGNPGEKPTVPGYHPESGKPGDKVTPKPGNPGEDVKVPYVKDQGTVSVIFHDDTTNTTIPNVGFNSGDAAADTPVTYNPETNISDLEKQGYVYVRTEGTLPDKVEANKNITVTVHMKHGVQPVTPTTPPTDVPKNTPKEAQPDQLTKKVNLTVNYVNADGTDFTGNVPANAKQTATFTGTAYVDKITGQLVNAKQEDGKWVINTDDTATPEITWTSDKTAFEGVTSPTEEGYHVSNVSEYADGDNVAAITGLTKDSQNITVTVTYAKNDTEIKNRQEVKASQVVKYVDENDNELSETKTQNFTFVYTGDTYDKETGKQIATGKWLAVSHDFSSEDVPTVNGYVAVKGFTRDDNDKVVAGGFTTAYDATDAKRNRVFKVIYKKVGKIVPQLPDGKPVPNVPDVPYTNDPTDPTAVTPDEPTPKDPTGTYTPEVPSVTPTNPTKDTPVVYHANEASLKVQYIDQDDNNAVLHTDSVDGKLGEKLTYTTADEIKSLEGQGYVLVNDGFTGKAGADFTKENNGKTYQVILKHGVQPVTPTTPPTDVPKNTPKEAQPDQLTKEVNLTVNYVNADGTAFTGTVPANAKQTATFTGTAYVDKITGKLVNAKQEDGKWVINTDDTATPEITWTSDKTAFEGVTSPAEANYHVSNVSSHKDGDNVAAITGLTKDSGNIDVTVTYAKNGTTVINGKKVTPTQTVKFVDGEGNELKPSIKETGADFVYSGDTRDEVTGQITKTGSWDSTSHIFGTQDVPVIPGYVAVSGYTNQNGKFVAGGLTATLDDPDVVATVVYQKVGNIVPQLPDGTPVPNPDKPGENVPNKPYTNDPTNPTDVNPKEPVPNIPGYRPEVPTVTPEVPTKDTPVVYNQIQKADLTIVDQDNGNKQIVVSGVTTKFTTDGINGEAITFTGNEAAVKALENMGYVYVDSDFTSGTKFDGDGATDQHFTITMKHGTQPVNPSTPGKPGEPINPNDPEGPKYPQGSDQVTKNVTRTIQYVDENGNKVSDSVEQPVNFTAEGVLDKVTGQWVTPLTWSGSQTVNGVKSPVVEGYHLVSVDRDGEGNNVKGVTLTHENDSYTVTVKYAKNGNIIPVDPTGKPIPNVPTPQYPTDPTDPSKVTPNEPVPSIPGLTPEVPTVTPTDPGKNTPVKYSQTVNATVTYIDDVTGESLKTDSLSGLEGVKSDYSTKTSIDGYEAQGYKVVSDNFPKGGYTFSVEGTHDFTVHLTHTTSPVNPDHPGAGYSATDLKKTVTRTINYLDGQGNVVAQQVAQSFDFIANGTVDNVTHKLVTVVDGKITGAGELTWNAANHDFDAVESPAVKGMHVTNVTPADQRDGNNVAKTTVNAQSGNIIVNVYYASNGTHQDGAKNLPSTQTVTFVDEAGNVLHVPSTLDFTFVRTPDVTDPEGNVTEGTWTTGTSHTYKTVNVPVIPGYVTDRTVAGGMTATIDNLDVADKVVYKKVGKIIPVDPTGKPIPGAPTPDYPNDPQNPTKVTPDEPVPSVPGYTPDVPTVTPGVPTVDTPVTYRQNVQATVTYIDDVTNTVLDSDSLNGLDGKKSDYSTAGKIANYESHGYALVSDDFPKDGYTFSVEGTHNFTVHLTHTTSPVNPDHPGAGYNKTDLQKDVTRTIYFVNTQDGKQVAEPVNQTVSFTANGTVDNVTGKLVTVADGKITGPGELTWTPAQDVKGVQSPAVNGMHVTFVTRDADGTNVKGVSLTHDDSSYDVYVNYAPNGTTNEHGQNIPASQTIKFIDENGNTLRENNVQTSEFVRTPDVVDAFTGKTITEGSWKETSHKFGVIDVPVIEGYVATVKTAGGLTATTDNPNVVTEVVYKKVGKIIPVDPTGKPIPNVPTPEYPNDPTDPTKVTPNEPVPTIPGYTPETPTVTPEVPTKDTPVKYTPVDNTQNAQVRYIDLTNNEEIANSGNLSGQPGDKINYSTADTIKSLTDKGYVLVNDGFPADAAFDNDKGHDQVFTVTFRHGTQPVNPNEPGKPGQPINPNDPEGPKYPQGSDQVTKNVTRTVQYVDENGNKISDPVEQTVSFTAEGVLDKVTGQWVTPLTWSGSQSVAGVKTPVVEGYHVVNVDRDGDGVNVKGVTLTHENDNYTVTVQYAKNGKIVPVDPTGKPIPNVPTPQYPTDPENPAKVTPDEPVPSIPGFVPEVPTVTPTDPGKDTPVHYTPVVNDQNAVVNYVDQDNNNAQIATSGNLTGKPGSLIDYSTAATIKQLEDQGYVLVNNGFPAGAVFDNDDNTTQTYTVVLKHGTTTFKPDKPGTPGEPINPNYPEGPKVTNEDVDYSKDVKFTVHYVGAGSNNPADNVQNAQWTRAITVDNVTGKIISSTEWVSNKDSYSNVATPVVEGYHADRAQVDGQKVTMEDQEATVTYVPNGKIVPVDPTGKPIPNVPTPQYPTDPTDPTKVTPNEPVPTIPNYTPEVPTVTPTDPGVDTPVKYTPNTVNPKPAVDQIAVVNYVDQDNNNAQIATSGNLTGKAGSVINYSTADQIKQLEARGYVLVTDGFPAGATFDDNADQNQVFTVVLKHGHAPVGPKNPEEPGTPVNPGYPEGPKWPAKDNYSKDYTSTVHFVDNNGNKMRDDNVQTSTWTRTLIIDKVTGQILNPNENWTSDKASYNEVKVPVINGYVADKANVPAKEAVQQNIEDTVTYTKVGNIVPVDPSGNRIPNVPVVPYTNDPTDPTKVVPNEPVPSVPGMTPNVTTVTPDHPTVDTPVVYTTPTPVTPQTPATPEPETPAEPARPAETPAQPAAPEAPAAPKAATPAKATPAAKQEAKKLPQTGNENSSSAAALGLAALGLTGLLAAGKKRRKED